MLTLVEDAIRDKGSINAEHSGVPIRALILAGLSQIEIERYSQLCYQFFQQNELESYYPEWVLQQLDQDWAIPPAPREAGLFPGNPRYIKHLIDQLGEKSGRVLELLADYILSCMPGCRTARGQRSNTHEYDIVCSMEGAELDFRSELGRYFTCECKDWNEKADVRTMAVLCRALDAVKSRFGILFSRSGITGGGEHRHAELEQLKIFQDRGTVIVVIDDGDLRKLAEGANFVALLRRRYEEVRLDLPKPKS